MVNDMASTICGSPLYMAPEILRGDNYDAMADLWSIGAVFFEIAYNVPPFKVFTSPYEIGEKSYRITKKDRSNQHDYIPTYRFSHINKLAINANTDKDEHEYRRARLCRYQGSDQSFVETRSKYSIIVPRLFYAPLLYSSDPRYSYRFSPESKVLFFESVAEDVVDTTDCAAICFVIEPGIS